VAFYNGVRLPYIPGEKEDWDTSGIVLNILCLEKKRF
jgi:hypothetical protein